MRSVTVNGLLVGAMSILGGCGQVDTSQSAGEVGTIQDEVLQPLLWQGTATCTTAKNNKKVKYVSCAATDVAAKADAAAACKGAYGNASTVVSVTVRFLRPLTTCTLPNGGGGGDPHMYTFDGLRYEFQPQGEFVFASDNESYNIQVRTQQWGGSRASVQTAVSVDMLDMKVGIYAREDQALRIDGQPVVMPCADGQIPANGGLCSGRMDFENGGWLTYDQNAKKFSVYLQDEASHLDVWLRNNNGGYLDTQFFAGPVIQTKTVGIVGTANGNRADDLISRDGNVLAQPVPFADMYNVFGKSWRIDAKQSTFDYQQGQNTESFTDVAFPGVPVTINDLTLAERDAGMAACKAAGVAVEALDACILDAALMGNHAVQGFVDIGRF